MKCTCPDCEATREDDPEALKLAIADAAYDARVDDEACAQ